MCWRRTPLRALWCVCSGRGRVARPGAARRGSDLDQAIDAGRPLTMRESGALADAFEESDLPHTVDLVDVRAASEGFVALIEREWAALPR